MRYRVMRLMIMFDLPVLTSENRRNYRKFRKALINEGFLMMQYSIYVRVCSNKKISRIFGTSNSCHETADWDCADANGNRGSISGDALLGW